MTQLKVGNVKNRWTLGLAAMVLFATACASAATAGITGPEVEKEMVTVIDQPANQPARDGSGVSSSGRIPPPDAARREQHRREEASSIGTTQRADPAIEGELPDSRRNTTTTTGDTPGDKAPPVTAPAVPPRP